MCLRPRGVVRLLRWRYFSYKGEGWFICMKRGREVVDMDMEYRVRYIFCIMVVST